MDNNKPRETLEQWKERASFWEDKSLLLEAMLKDAPNLPNPKGLSELADVSIRGDWEKGKELQRRFGVEVIPPICECECGAGAWFRITGGTADFSTIRQKKEEIEG